MNDCLLYNLFYQHTPLSIDNGIRFFSIIYLYVNASTDESVWKAREGFFSCAKGLPFVMLCKGRRAAAAAGRKLRRG